MAATVVGAFFFDDEAAFEGTPCVLISKQTDCWDAGDGLKSRGQGFLGLRMV